MANVPWDSSSSDLRDRRTATREAMTLAPWSRTTTLERWSCRRIAHPTVSRTFSMAGMLARAIARSLFQCRVI